MWVQHFVPMHLVHYEIIHWLSENLLVKKSQGIRNVWTKHPLGTMKICTNINGNPNNCKGKEGNIKVISI